MYLNAFLYLIQSSTEWKRKLNHLNSIHNETLLSDLSTLDETHNHRNHHKHNSTHIKGEFLVHFIRNDLQLYFF